MAGNGIDICQEPARGPGPDPSGVCTAEDDPRWINLDKVGAALAVCTLSGTLLSRTEPAKTILELVGVDASTVPHRLPDELTEEILRTPPGESTVWAPEGTRSEAQLGFTRYPMSGTEVLLLMREMTTRYRSLARQFHKQRLEVMGQLVAMIAHDLRAPLSSIVFVSESLAGNQRDSSPHSLKKSIEEIQAAARRLQSSIDGLLHFARIGPPVCVEISIDEVLERVQGLLRPAIREGGHQLAVTISPDAAHAMGNPILLEQIVVNLLMNAMEAQRGPVRISACAKLQQGSQLVTAAFRDSEALICITVSDDGPGIPEPLRPRVFEPFFTTKSQGTGLGLAMARESIREQGGDLILEPSYAGAVFSIYLMPVDENSSARLQAKR